MRGKKLIDPELGYGWEGPRDAQRTTRIAKGAADVLDSEAEELGSSRALPDAEALEFVAALFIAKREPGETLRHFLRELYTKLR